MNSLKQFKTAISLLQCLASNVMTRHAFMINGMNAECAELAQNIRTEILMGKNQFLKMTARVVQHLKIYCAHLNLAIRLGFLSKFMVFILNNFISL